MLNYGKTIGDGEFAVVYQCNDEKSSNQFALKKVRTNIVAQEVKAKVK